MFLFQVSLVGKGSSVLFLLCCALLVCVVVSKDPVEEKRCIITGIPESPVDTTARLVELRKLMTQNSLDAYIVPTEDAHQSEYTSDHDERRRFISGFSGSAGTAIILKDKAAQWTDGRYFLQAADELDCNWILMRAGQDGVPTQLEWLKENLVADNRVGADATLLSIDSWDSYKTELSKSNISMVVGNGLIDSAWTTTGVYRPLQSDSDLLLLDIKYSGKAWKDKLKDVQKEMVGVADTLIISGLDEIAWFFNLRGEDISYNPVFFAYAIISNATDGIPKLYVRGYNKRFSALEAYFVKECCVEVKNYDDFYGDLGNATANLISSPGTVWISSALSQAIKETIVSTHGKNVEIVEDRSPIKLLKAVKNTVEQEGMKKSHIRDSAAIIKFVSRLEEEVRAGYSWNEMKVAKEILEQRRKMDNNKGASFGTIAGFGSNGAIIHYTPTPESNKSVTTENLLLLDSGGQYLDGTTDITRTFHFGTPTYQQKEAYTLVLKGAIDLAKTIWPSKSIKGGFLDPIARAPLWSRGLDYRHGTGHGIGMYLSVHEGPARIGSGITAGSSVIYPGMFFSDEPGYYEDGKFGIRLETIVMAALASTPNKFDGEYLKFVPIALVPFEPNLILTDLLTNEERIWLNFYHKECLDKVGPSLTGDERAMNWLKLRTSPVNLLVESSPSSSSHPSVHLVTFLMMVVSAVGLSSPQVAFI